MTVVGGWPARVDVSVDRNVLRWRPWVVLSQAQYNAMDPGDFDPGTLYVVAPQRVYQGPNALYPPPYGAGIISATRGNVVNGANPVQTIPTTTPGNLVVLILASRISVVATIASVTDSANQIWKQAVSTGQVGSNAFSAIQCWYYENSVAIDSVRLTAASSIRAWWVCEVGGIAQSDALDNTSASSGGGLAAQSITVERRSLVVHAVNRASAALPVNRPSGWNALDDWGTYYDDVSAFVAYRVAEIGATVAAQWSFPAGATATGMISAAFRIAEP